MKVFGPFRLDWNFLVVRVWTRYVDVQHLIYWEGEPVCDAFVWILSQDRKAWQEIFLVYLEGTLSSGIYPWIVVEFCGVLNVHVLTFVTMSFPFFFTCFLWTGGVCLSLEHKFVPLPFVTSLLVLFCTSGFDLDLFSLYFLSPFTGCFV